ncbi:two-component system sensor histidine kinase YesM [Paenibacillus phyllosphaerae]|uniref:histidine kinase n=1 Tax=Paenibacillus phyllosphaerae TaxID=274593 RepID=A0A7W5B246_9BACL|nr:sensor histidine kinase [Paenibacillus phyllosphaerae]MBB3113028.1 two-component system sensor histidine kinase YesM [Paenibacillus phyllosphaerae]
MKMTIRTKILGSTVLVVSLSLILSSYIVFTNMARIVREQAVKDNMTKLAQTSSSLTRMQDRLFKTAETIIADDEINTQLIRKPEASMAEAYFDQVAVMKQLKRFVALDASLLNIMIIRYDGKVFSNYSGYDSYYEAYLQEAWFAPFKSGSGGTRFSEVHEFSYINGEQDVISYVIPYRNWEDKTQDEPYYLVMDMKQNEIAKVFKESREDFERIVLRSGDGRIIYDTEAASPGQGLQPSGDFLALRYDAMSEGWSQEAFISKRKLYESIRPLLLFHLAIAAAGLLFILLLVLPLILNFTRPITVLARAMRRVSAGELRTSVNIRSGDEMQVLGEGFNQMVHELDTWMKSAMREEEMKRNMQINLLLSEINPHFIYNTLNTVIYLSHAERSKDTITITKALIDILQDTIKTGEQAFFSTLAQERQLVEKYVSIQQYRYPGRFRLEWEIPEQLGSCAVLRLMIQPLVENALFHGIFDLEEEGVITVTARADDSDLFVTVADNGIGIDDRPSALDWKRSPVHSGQTKGIGLANIQERILFHYGEPYGIAFESISGEGTSVTIRLPYIAEAERTA